jgi:hypothetical protein
LVWPHSPTDLGGWITPLLSEKRVENELHVVQVGRRKL